MHTITKLRIWDHPNLKQTAFAWLTIGFSFLQALEGYEDFDPVSGAFDQGGVEEDQPCYENTLRLRGNPALQIMERPEELRHQRGAGGIEESQPPAVYVAPDNDKRAAVGDDKYEIPMSDTDRYDKLPSRNKGRFGLRKLQTGAVSSPPLKLPAPTEAPPPIPGTFTPAQQPPVIDDLDQYENFSSPTLPRRNRTLSKPGASLHQPSTSLPRNDASLPRSKPSLSRNNSSVSRRDASLSHRNPETIDDLDCYENYLH